MAEVVPAALLPVEGAIKAMYKVRDEYFTTNSVETGGKVVAKKTAVTTALREIKDQLGNLEDEDGMATNPHFLYMRGWALNVTEDYAKKVEDCLAKVVKLLPQHVEAWNQLGECFWKKRDFPQAKTCFTSAKDISANKVSLRSLSMLLRQLPTSEPIERQNNIEESLTLAKDAIKLDVSDGASWFVLGNAYLAIFFSKMENIEHIRQALKAYKQAEKDTNQAANNPDLHQNRATIHKFLEEYGSAIEGYQMAALLDPDWPEPRSCLESLVSKLKRTVDLIRKKCHTNKGKLEGILAALDTLPASDGTPAKDKYTLLADLKQGVNTKLETRLTLMASVDDEKLPRTFVAVDAAGTWACVTIYNVDEDAVKVDHTIVVPEPYFRTVKMNLGGPGQASKVAEFPSIRVDNPVTLQVNGLALGEGKLVKAELQIQAKSE